ncbi:MAG TPA: NAD(P)H-hydrate dehydratase [Saprospiraceae bacterium]|nr:NAD(P)H-hydrate dehydratase [Saprospiraceae bacterium]HMP22991.1 NAD(P)H-hydrate dehydratase [Saprospiraceae bacterium]
MKILSAEQIRALDAYTMAQEPLGSLDLMERAALTFVQWFVQQFPDTDAPVHIFCGPGNNGGDGLAVARLLHQQFYTITIWICEISAQTSPDFQANLERLPQRSELTLHTLVPQAPLPALPTGIILVDAIFGSGLNRPVAGYWADLLTHLNEQPIVRVAIDVPSGLFADQHTTGACIRAHYTFSFEMPKLAFFFPENQDAVGEWHHASIGLNTDFIARTPTPFHLVDAAFAQRLLHPRRKFNHKGTFGHALLVVGSYGKVGAAILAARACLRSGVGLVTVHAPKSAYPILQMSIPEAMVSVDQHEFYLSEIPNLTPYKAIGIGCGLDQRQTTLQALEMLLEKSTRPLVLDADALNLLARHRHLLPKIPPRSILTPHVREFERLFGNTSDDFARNTLQREQAQALGVYIVLKGAHTCTATPEGDGYFNTTGNPGMATGGSGDVLTGIITGLLAQSFTPLNAALLGVYLHGRAGDLAAATMGEDALIASDIIQHLGQAFLHCKAYDAPK